MKGARITVPATAGGIVIADGTKNSGPGYPFSATIQVPSAGGQTVALGGADVTFATGFEVAAGGVITVTLVNEKLYGIVTSGTQVVQVLRTGD
jgi:hypothetical protein